MIRDSSLHRETGTIEIEFVAKNLMMVLKVVFCRRPARIVFFGARERERGEFLFVNV
jgi:hypothetical protein